VTMCQEAWPEPGADTWHTCYTFFVLLTTYLLPLGVTGPAYTAVACRLWQRRAPGNADTARDLHQLKSKRRVRIIVRYVLRMNTVPGASKPIGGMPHFASWEMFGGS